MLPKRKYINLFKFLNQNIKTNQYKIIDTKIINIEKYWQRNLGKNRMMISCLGLGDYQRKLCVQKITGLFSISSLFLVYAGIKPNLCFQKTYT